MWTDANLSKAESRIKYDWEYILLTLFAEVGIFTVCKMARISSTASFCKLSVAAMLSVLSMVAFHKSTRGKSYLPLRRPVHSQIKSSASLAYNDGNSRVAWNRTRCEQMHVDPSRKYYVDPLADISVEYSFNDLPLPIQVLEKYKMQHSVEALQKNPDILNRKFAIGFYMCPLKAGNKMHQYLNGE